MRAYLLQLKFIFSTSSFLKANRLYGTPAGAGCRVCHFLTVKFLFVVASLSLLSLLVKIFYIFIIFQRRKSLVHPPRGGVRGMDNSDCILFKLLNIFFISFVSSLYISPCQQVDAQGPHCGRPRSLRSYCTDYGLSF